MPSTKTKEMSAEERKAKMNEEREFLQKFMEAALSGDGEKVESLALKYSVEKKVQPFDVYKDFRDGSKRSAIHFACSSPANVKGQDDIVVRLLKKSNLTQDQIEALLLSEDEDGLTPLMHACNKLHEGSYDRIKCLLELGGSKVALMKSKAGAMALHYAAGNGANKAIIKLIHEKCPDAIKILSTKIGSPLHWASGVPSGNDYSGTIRALIDECAGDVNQTNSGGLSPLILAATLSMPLKI